MAIYNSVPPPEQQIPSIPATLSLPVQATTPIDIQTWTTTSALASLAISPSARGTGVTLSIPLEDEDERPKSAKKRSGGKEGSGKDGLMRRDSMKRRDALLRGKEGSRRRQRWENDHLLHVPNAQPPLPSDWAPCATHRVHHIPYYLAPLWDAGIRHRAEELSSLKFTPAGTYQEVGKVPSELKRKVKKSKGAKTLLQELELEIRTFVKEFEDRERGVRESGEAKDELDSEDEEIVFIGRDKDGKGITMSDEAKDVVEEELQRERVVYEGVEGREGGFARWLVHELAGYYGLSSRSETIEGTGRGGKGGVRRALVGMKMNVGRKSFGGGMPRPLWGMV